MRLSGLFVAAVFVCSAAEAYTPAERRHWAFQPRKQVDAASIDAILRPKGRLANRRTLIRRVYFDLTGLPPTPEEVERFVDDRSPDAWPKLVDRLLASPEYGEHWGRHWLDVVRFAETDGFEYDTHRPDAWRYRDYVIRSFTRTSRTTSSCASSSPATRSTRRTTRCWSRPGFNRLGPLRKNAGNQDVACSRNEVLTEMTNVVGSAFLGVTLGCARCHDHKFDPIRQKRLLPHAGVLRHDAAQRHPALHARSSRPSGRSRTEPIEAELKALRAKLQAAPRPGPRPNSRSEIARRNRNCRRRCRCCRPWRTIPAKYTSGSRAGARRFAQAGRRGRACGRSGSCCRMARRSGRDDTPTPRLALAKWITDPANPLTARVMVNRIWQHHFGTGIVATPNDFGRMGARPSHPELLDWLANQFVEGGWSMKPLHRMILLSSTYRQDYRRESAADAREGPREPPALAVPAPAAQAEEIRDAMLAVPAG